MSDGEVIEREEEEEIHDNNKRDFLRFEGSHLSSLRPCASSSRGLTYTSEDMDYELNRWARSRAAKIGTDSRKIMHVTDPSYDPLAYIVCTYMNMLPARNKQCDEWTVRKQFVMKYKTHCKQRGEPLKVYAPLMVKDKTALQLTCKLLVSDLRLFFMSDADKGTMSLCMLPFVERYREVLTPAFFMDPTWRQKLLHEIRKIPSEEEYAVIQTLLKVKPVTPAFKNEQVNAMKLQVERVLSEGDEFLQSALDLTFVDDDERAALLKQASRRLTRAAAYIGNIVSNPCQEVAEEMQDPVSFATMETLGRYEVEIARKLGIKTLIKHN